jgi:hypothetical protein
MLLTDQTLYGVLPLIQSGSEHELSINVWLSKERAVKAVGRGEYQH